MALQPGSSLAQTSSVKKGKKSMVGGGKVDLSSYSVAEDSTVSGAILPEIRGKVRYRDPSFCRVALTREAEVQVLCSAELEMRAVMALGEEERPASL